MVDPNTLDTSLVPRCNVPEYCLLSQNSQNTYLSKGPTKIFEENPDYTEDITILKINLENVLFKLNNPKKNRAPVKQTKKTKGNNYIIDANPQGTCHFKKIQIDKILKIKGDLIYLASYKDGVSDPVLWRRESTRHKTEIRGLYTTTGDDIEYPMTIEDLTLRSMRFSTKFPINIQTNNLVKFEFKHKSNYGEHIETGHVIAKRFYHENEKTYIAGPFLEKPTYHKTLKGLIDNIIAAKKHADGEFVYRLN